MTESTPPAALDYVEAVHRLAAMVPTGAVLSYGDVAELLGRGGARQVGTAMRSAPENTPWWRILRSDGTINAELIGRAEPLWEAEAITTPARRVPMNRKRWQPSDAQWEAIDVLRQALGQPKLSERDDQL